ncbi:MAG: FG-GAP repeat domain-containing protein, partial [Phycisphaerae bacterium]
MHPSFPFHTRFRNLARCGFLAASQIVWAAGSPTLGQPQPSVPPDAGTPKVTEPAVADGVKAEFMAVARRLKQSTNPFLGELQVPQLRKQLQEPGLTLERKAVLQMRLSGHLLRLGKVEEGIEAIETSCRLVRRIPNRKQDLPPELHWSRGLAYLRKAEVANCIQRHNADCCIFPLKGGGVHSFDGPAREARKSYLALLKQNPEHLSARWLVNLVSMALNDYPDGVSKPFLIPLSAFDSDYPIKRFVDIAPKLGVHTFNLCGGTIVDDFDNDGLLDIITSTFDPDGPLTFYRNPGTGRFQDASASSGCDQQLGGLNCMGTDYDNDGLTDVLILRGAWLFDDGRIRNSLLHNEGDGTFTDVTRRAGLADPAMPTQAAVWADFDNDGDLDLFVGNESRIAWGRGG